MSEYLYYKIFSKTNDNLIEIEVGNLIEALVERINLQEKLSSIMSILEKDKEIYLSFVFDKNVDIVGIIFLPASVMEKNTDSYGKYIDPNKSFLQRDLFDGKVVATFATYQIIYANIRDFKNENLIQGMLKHVIVPLFETQLMLKGINIQDLIFEIEYQCFVCK